MNHTIHADTSIGYVALKVKQLKRSLSYYQDVIGLRILKQDQHKAVLTEDGIKPLLKLEELPEAQNVSRKSRAGLYHFALLVPSRKALGLSLRHLMAHHFPVGQGDHLVSEALYINDPDENGIEIYADRPRSEWPRDEHGQIQMASDPVDIDGLLEEAGDTAWTGLHPGTTIGHIHLHVSYLPETEQFYCGLLGFEKILNYGGQALFISAGGYHHHIGLNTWAGVGAPAAAPDAVGLRYYTIMLPDAAALEQIEVKLQEASVVVKDQFGGRYIQDPSGNGIVLITKSL